MKYVHIAGTNGKGSVAEYISNIIIAAGYRCGCYISPHLVFPEERMRVNGECISCDELNNLMDEVNKNKLAVNDSLFAAYTAAALLWFSKMDVQYAVLETGLGGRLDPTNYVTPEVSVLTSIDYDHTNILGKTLEEIAEEKCGIIKPGIPVVSSAQHDDVKNKIMTHCSVKNSNYKFVENVKILSSSLDGQEFEFENHRYKIKSIGAIQPENAALSVLAAKAIGINKEYIKSGLYNTQLISRTQYIKGTPDILLDGGHNPAAADALINTLNIYFKGKKKVLLFACMKDKDYRTIIEKVQGQFSEVVITNVEKSRGESSQVLCGLFSDKTNCLTEDNPETAFIKAKNIAINKDALLVISGSFYLAGRILKILNIS